MIKIMERVQLTEKDFPFDTIELNYDDRKRGRLRTCTNGGIEVGLFLERGKCLQANDGLKAETGELFQIKAALEEVVTAKATDSLQFAKVCYHLGNRHVPLHIGDHWLRFQPDHVLEDLCKLQGLTISKGTAPFQPESGAYSSHHSHSHSEDTAT